MAHASRRAVSPFVAICPGSPPNPEPHADAPGATMPLPINIPNLPVSLSLHALENSPAQGSERLEAAAKEFEAMLIQRLLKAAREAGRLYESEDAMTGGEGYLALAEQQFARVLAERGIFGFARLLVKNVPVEPLSGNRES